MVAPVFNTEVARDGMLTGPATDRLAQVLAATSRPVIASGGVATLDDLRALATLEPSGLEGAIVGKALYAGRFTVTDALATLAEDAPNPGAQASQPPGARASQPPVAGAPEREGSRRVGGAGGAVHSPPTHLADGGAG